MNKEDIINTFLVLREVILKLDSKEKDDLFSRAAAVNPWYTPDNIRLALDGICQLLAENQLRSWAERYPEAKKLLKVGIVMAGNIPLVGFHDLLCVLVAGHSARVKLSSQDEVLPKFIIRELGEINPELTHKISVVDKLSEIDAVIATGSDNSARYFKKYFNNYPHIIRKNRTSVAVLKGDESNDELAGLANDIFTYFGMGCRNVAKIYVPTGYDATKMLDHFETWAAIANHPKYFNNYEYNKAIYLVNKVEHLDTGFALFSHSHELVSPLSVVYLEEYQSLNDVEKTLDKLEDKLQCTVGKVALNKTMVPFGKAQSPAIDDYADNVDTMKFLTEF